MCHDIENELYGPDFGWSLKMSDEKLDVLLTVIERIADVYPEADFYSWARKLVLVQDFYSYVLGDGVGLFHAFQQTDEKIQTQGNEADFWMFLCPNGVEYDALDGKPVHAIIGLVMPIRRHDVECKLLGSVSQLVRRVDDENNPGQFWKQLAKQQPATAARQVNIEMAKCLQETC